MAATRRNPGAVFRFRAKILGKTVRVGATLRAAMALAGLSKRTAGEPKRLPRDLSSRDPL